MRRFTTFLTLAALVFIVAACGGGDESAANTDSGNADTTQNDGGTAPTGGGAAPAQGPIEVEITADRFNPASAEVTLGQGINFNNNDSKPHVIKGPGRHEQVVKGGRTYKYRGEGCCAATFTDEETGARFRITVE